MNKTSKRYLLFRQRGVTTLAVTMLLLSILAVIVLFSTNVAYFEQRTTTHENRARLAEQAAEYSTNLAGEFIKANRGNIIGDTGTGWLSVANRRWVQCSTVMPVADGGTSGSATPAGHPCLSERDVARRVQLWFYSQDGTAGGNLNLPYTTAGQNGAIPAAAQLTTVGGTAAFPVTTQVQVVLCRIDTTLEPDALGVLPVGFPCRANPAAGNRVAITMVGSANLTGEGAGAQVRETWASVSDFMPTSAVPLVASGLVQGLGNAQIVASANAGGPGIPATIWAPSDVDIQGPGSIGSVSTCQVGEFLKNTASVNLKTTCATSATACGCPAISASGEDFLSGHSGSVKVERNDVLDIDGNQGKYADGVTPTPDIQFFPGQRVSDGVSLDTAVDDDDSLFEYTFNVNYESCSPNNNGGAGDCGVGDTKHRTRMKCGDSGTQDCAVFALQEQLGAQTHTGCAGFGPTTSGLHYVSGACNFPNNVIGSPTNPVIIVAEGSADLSSTFYGMLYVRSPTGAASFTGSGNRQLFGSLIVEGNVNITGSFTLVYDDTSLGGSTNQIPPSAKFGRVPGSWLDDQSAF